MSSLSLGLLAQALGASASAEAACSRVWTDTRSIQPGDLFVALSGEHFDGNAFVAEAVKKGAVAAVVSRKPDIDIPHIVVEDTRWALGIIARVNRRHFTGKLLALTGSAGKTSCKEMLAAILSECGNTHSTQGNFNNEVGVPLTLLRLSEDQDYAVIEMGAAKGGDIAYLCEFAEPDIALVTNAMAAHIEGFGSLETVAKTKGEIFQSLPADGVAIINLDSPFFPLWQAQAAGRSTMTFSLENSAADVYARQIQLSAEKGVAFTFCCPQGEAKVQLQLLGQHNIANALAAGAAALAAGANLDQLVAGLENVGAVNGRLTQLQAQAGFTVIDDSYNANPEAVKAAIDVLAGFEGRHCLVLGNMAELGEESESLHREVGAYAKEKGIKQVLAIGEFADAVIEGFGIDGESFHEMEQLLSHCRDLSDVDVVLVKGSRSAKMERVVTALCHQKGNH